MHIGSATTIVIAGNDNRGLLFGVGYLLRKLEMEPNRAMLATDINITTAPQYPVRGQQIGYRYKNNTYDAWTVAQFDQQTRDLAVFGNNTIQVVAPNSDDRNDSPLFPAPALETLIGICKSTISYGLDFDLYYPEMAKDYSDPAQVDAELQKADALFRALPHIDALYVPGGDPGHTEPRYLLPLVEKEAEILHKYHPHAKVWISAQGFNAAWYSEFYSILREQHPKFITGFFVGPQSRDSFPLQRRMIPAQYQLQAYPDIAHSMHAQFAMPDWDPAYAFSEGREPIDPRPMEETNIYRTFAGLHSGFVTYSEGVNDDVNKVIWDQLGWSSQTDPMDTLRDYSRYFLGSQIGPFDSSTFADAIMGLERNWNGSPLTNRGVDTTLLQFQALERAADAGQLRNWRFEMALYRAYYDAYIRARLLRETCAEQQALAILRSAPEGNSIKTIAAAREALNATPHSSAQDLRKRIFELADNLFHDAGMQLSTQKYGASGIERGANLDRVDVNLNNRAWMEKQFDRLEKLPTEAGRQAGLSAMLHYEDPGPGGFYDDLGDPSDEPHLVMGEGASRDPQLYATTVNGIADKIPDEGLRISTITYAETLYDTPVEMRYEDLDPAKHYRLRVTYGGEDYTLPIRLIANDAVEIHAPLRRKGNPETLEFDIPQSATTHGKLDLKWTRPTGAGGGGRGLQIAEVWLITEAAR
ncbi:hypothetical protein [Silvibacterium acidisoli]|uniref:hypothetical protein n=1 Tax=Acidobacteriaceae bacterium ZG23-2 TaxID=2883246 RepID=UPI00406D48F5